MAHWAPCSCSSYSSLLFCLAFPQSKDHKAFCALSEPTEKDMLCYKPLGTHLNKMVYNQNTFGGKKLGALKPPLEIVGFMSGLQIALPTEVSCPGQVIYQTDGKDVQQHLARGFFKATLYMYMIYTLYGCNYIVYILYIFINDIYRKVQDGSDVFLMLDA